jgi:CHAT domain-containing protein
LFTNVADSVEDARLHAYEIYNLRLGSNLAVLSACNTGYGEINRGEGIMSLSRAFMYAGCPSIVMSLWRAKDQPTTQIITRFFEKLKDEIPKDEALRQAKLNYLQKADPLKAHPANWATFVLLGNAEPVQVITSTRKWWVAGLLFFIMVTLVFYFRKRKANVLSS